MGSLQQICLRWNNHQSNFPKVFDELLQSKDLVDVTLTCDGRTVDAHKVVLSACSPYFRKLFQNNPCKHPIVFMRDVKYSELEAIIEFMYKGEVNVARDDLTDFLRTAQALQIKGLAEEKNASDKSESVAPKVQQSITLPRSTLPALTPIQPVQNNISNSNSLLHPSAAKKLRLAPTHHSPSVTSTPKLSVTPQSTPPHIVDAAGNNSPHAQSLRKLEGSSNDMDRLVKLEMSNDEIDDDDDSHDEASGEDQQGLDMLMESTLETGDEHYVVGESEDGSMFSHGLEKNSDSASELSQLGASTSGISNQLLQTEDSMFVRKSFRPREYKNWTKENMVQAISDVIHFGCSITSTAKRYGIPSETLRRRVIKERIRYEPTIIELPGGLANLGGMGGLSELPPGLTAINDNLSTSSSSCASISSSLPT